MTFKGASPRVIREKDLERRQLLGSDRVGDGGICHAERQWCMIAVSRRALTRDHLWKSWESERKQD
jgi:hypothetical protein